MAKTQHEYIFYFSIKHGNNLTDQKFACNKYREIDIKRIYKCDDYNTNNTFPADNDAFIFDKLIRAYGKLNNTSAPYLLQYHVDTPIKGKYMFIVGFANIPVYSSVDHKTLQDHTGEECKFDGLIMFPYKLNHKDREEQKTVSILFAYQLKELLTSTKPNGLSSLLGKHLGFVYQNSQVNAQFNFDPFFTELTRRSAKANWPTFNVEVKGKQIWLDDGYIYVYYPNSNKYTLLDPPIEDSLKNIGKVAGAAIGTYAGAKMLSSETYRNWIQEFIANNPESSVVLQTILNNPKSSIVLGAIGTYLAAKGLPALGKKFTAFIKEKLGMQSST